MDETSDAMRRLRLNSCEGVPILSTKFWTNSPEIVQEFKNKTCTCTEPHQRIEGVQDGHQLSQWAQRFPVPLCAAIAMCVMADHP